MKTKLASINSSIFSFFNVVTLQWKNQGGHLTTFGEHIKWVFIGKFTSRMRNPLSSGILYQKFEGSRTVFRSCHPFITQIILLTNYTQPSNDLLSLGIIIGIIMFIEIPCVHFFINCFRLLEHGLIQNKLALCTYIMIYSLTRSHARTPDS